jgi:hypothetical protein
MIELIENFAGLNFGLEFFILTVNLDELYKRQMIYVFFQEFYGVYII